MEALDGNAIAGQLFEVFGQEMTMATGTCAHCGATGQIAELRVFSRAPGAVVRCRRCGSAVIVLVEIRGVTQMMLDDFGLLDRAAPQTQPGERP
jgi:DNA-directed RNA polymerase subunit RPC12/RpoP